MEGGGYGIRFDLKCTAIPAAVAKLSFCQRICCESPRIMRSRKVSQTDLVGAYRAGLLLTLDILRGAALGANSTSPAGSWQ